MQNESIKLNSNEDDFGDIIFQKRKYDCLLFLILNMTIAVSGLLLQKNEMVRLLSQITGSVPQQMLEIQVTISLFISAVILLLIPITKATVVHFTAMYFNSSRMYLQTLSYTFKTYLIVNMGILIKGVLMYTLKSYYVTFSLAIFMNDPSDNLKLFSLLNKFDVFSWIYLAASIYATYKVHKLSYSKATFAVLWPSIFFIGINTAVFFLMA